MNILKTTILILMVAVLFAWTTGCKKSDQQKLAEAQLIEENQARAVNEWQTFRNEQEAMIAANDLIIADYKARMTDSRGKLLAAYDKQVEDLEKKNKELKAKLDNYTDEGKNSWEKFKDEFNRDINELGTALKNFGVDKK